VHSLDCFAFSVPDIEDAQRFYEAFGLEVRRMGSQLQLFTHGHPHRWAIVLEEPKHPKRLQFLSFGCYAADFPQLTEYLKERRFAQAAAHPAGSTGGIWLLHPDGVLVQVVPAEKSTPDYKSGPSVTAVAQTRIAVAPNRSKVARVTPRRLSHVLLFSSNVIRAIAFYEDALGLRLSDQSGDGIAFLHGVHGSDHHLVAVAKSEGGGLHHCSWTVGSVDEVGVGMQQMFTAGYAQGWGVGRHVLGSNYFYYARDPWGSYCEYSFDIDYVPQGYPWKAADHPPEDSFYMWGPPVPKEFVTNYELADAPPCVS